VEDTFDRIDPFNLLNESNRFVGHALVPHNRVPPERRRSCTVPDELRCMKRIRMISEIAAPSMQRTFPVGVKVAADARPALSGISFDAHRARKNCRDGRTTALMFGRRMPAIGSGVATKIRRSFVVYRDPYASFLVAPRLCRGSARPEE